MPAGEFKGEAWWTTLVVIVACAAVFGRELARRLRPLAALLELSLLFPDRPPSRVRMAMHIASSRQLRRDLATARHLFRPFG
jgi:hypothetical protein